MRVVGDVGEFDVVHDDEVVEVGDEAGDVGGRFRAGWSFGRWRRWWRRPGCGPGR